jgi:hypothetical protein
MPERRRRRRSCGFHGRRSWLSILLVPLPEDPLGDLIATDRPPLPTWKRALLVGGGVLFLVLGMAGWLIPLVTGIPFYIVGLVMLGSASRRFAEWINGLDRRLPFKARRLLRRAKRRREAKA